MDKLPQELYDHVISFYLKDLLIFHPAFLALATVSRKFQNSVERHTFRDIQFTATDLRLDELTHILTPRRCCFLQRLTTKIVLSSYPSELFTKFETERDRRANNEAVTAALKRIFYAISTLFDRNDNITPMLNLTILGPHSPPVKEIRPFIQWIPPNRQSRIGFILNHNAARYRFSLLDLTSDFTISNGRRKWSPRAAILLSAKMVEAESIKWDLDCDEDHWGRHYGMDRRQRNDLVQSIMSADLPASTTRFYCCIPSPLTDKRQMLLPQFITPGDYDPVSCAFRYLTRNYTHVHIISTIHSTLLNPPTGVLNGVRQCWNNIETLRVTAFMYNPEEKWLFKLENGVNEDQSFSIPFDQLPPGYGDTKEELEEREKYYNISRHMVEFDLVNQSERVMPNYTELNALFTAFARTCCRLPKLKEACIEVVCQGVDIWQYEVGCLAPGTPFPRGKPMPAHDMSLWRSTVEELKMIGRTRDGRDPIFLWGESLC
ncbi:hypothetical protein F4813DRAFT_382746 [Daldinia decipiens]|uniref:uncharacterized protein n=1 Tax=Daldinia decipiens TaxID=326647 RepID=UPI0020C49061|nr:uncharacterized protein F4813DRAFT_382746 [Daldinia decipiens]KAI1654319.1 hypothetical protein F4813DRAFT_382746 [Daldinia decipiens]